MKKINFGEGSLTFWIPKETLNYGDNKFIYLINYVSEEGSLKIVKDKDNGLKVFYNYLNNGKCILKVPVQDLDDEEKHYIGVTWSMPNRKVILYIDGQERGNCDIDITS